MAIRDDLMEALNACIERSNAGESLDAILQDYPELAKQLRLLMEAGLSVRRGRFQTAVVEQGRLKADSQIREAINTLPGSGGFPLMPILGLLIGGSILLAVIFNFSSQNTPDASPSQEQIPSLLASEAITEIPLVEQTTEALNTNAAPTATPDGIITVIEGPVDAIEDSSIFIYGLEIALEANDPYLQVIQPGDVLRIEALDDGGQLVIITLTFTNVEAFVHEGMVWRDNGDCSNPPPAWAAAEAWHQRCEGGAPITDGSGLPPLPEGCKYTGFGNNNITIKCSESGP
jgi:hypothetical protein